MECDGLRRTQVPWLTKWPLPFFYLFNVIGGPLRNGNTIVQRKDRECSPLNSAPSYIPWQDRRLAHFSPCIGRAWTTISAAMPLRTQSAPYWIRLCFLCYSKSFFQMFSFLLGFVIFMQHTEACIPTSPAAMMPIRECFTARKTTLMIRRFWSKSTKEGARCQTIGHDYSIEILKLCVDNEPKYTLKCLIKIV